MGVDHLSFSESRRKRGMKKNDYDIQTIFHGFHSYLAGQKHEAHYKPAD